MELMNCVCSLSYLHVPQISQCISPFLKSSHQHLGKWVMLRNSHFACELLWMSVIWTSIYHIQNYLFLSLVPYVNIYTAVASLFGIGCWGWDGD